MPGIYQSNIASIINRTPTTGNGAGAAMAYSRSVIVGGPQIEPLNSETPTQWSPYGTLVAHPYRKPMPYSLMSVEQATGFLNSAQGPWPRSGQADYPNGYVAAIETMRLQPSSSARKGYMNPVGPNPNMVFFAPPVFGLTTQPIYATGML